METAIWIIVAAAVISGVIIIPKILKKKRKSIQAIKPVPEIPNIPVVIPEIPVVISPPCPLNWPDRRFIGQIMFASAPPREEDVILGNRQWKLNGQMATSENFVKELFRHVQGSINILKSMDAQGVLLHDLEGQEFFHPISYMGQPQMLHNLAPEMNAVADQVFALLRDEGFRTGVTIRADTITWYEDKKIWWHHVAKDPVSNLSAKIRYCKERWGCTLFYWDSNVYEDNSILPDDIIKTLNQLHPDVLIMPEWEGDQLGYWKHGAPYKNLHQYRVDVVPRIKEKVPEAFMVLNIGYATGDLNKSVQEGNILMGRVWHDSPELPAIKEAYSSKKQ